METTMDLKRIIRIIKTRRAFILKVFTTFIVMAAVISFIMPSTYEAETDLRIKQPKGLANSLLADLPMGNTLSTKQQMSTYAEILKSRTVVQTVIDKTMANEENQPNYETMLKRITTRPVKDTEILKITVRAKSPSEAQYVANTLVDTFIDRLTFLARSEQTVVREFIGERLKEAKSDLSQAESALEQYKRDQQIYAPEEETKAIVDKLSNLDKLAAENAVGLVSNQARLTAAEKQLSRQKPGFIADSPLIQQYKGKLAEQEVQLAGLLENYTDKYPQVVAVRASIAETKAKLNNEIDRVINAEAPSMNLVHQGLLQGQIQAEAEIAAANAQKYAIQSILDKSQQQINTLPSKEKGLSRVMRDVAVTREIYIMLAKRYEEARISEVMQPTDVQVIDVAVAPEKPVSPKVLLNIIIAAILGLFAGLGSAFFVEHMNKTLRTAEDVKEYLDLPVLGGIPDFADNQEKIAPGFWSRILHIKPVTRHKGG